MSDFCQFSWATTKFFRVEGDWTTAIVKAQYMCKFENLQIFFQNWSFES